MYIHKLEYHKLFTQGTRPNKIFCIHLPAVYPCDRNIVQGYIHMVPFEKVIRIHLPPPRSKRGPARARRSSGVALQQQDHRRHCRPLSRRILHAQHTNVNAPKDLTSRARAHDRRVHEFHHFAFVPQLPCLERGRHSQKGFSVRGALCRFCFQLVSICEAMVTHVSYEIRVLG